jgi:outer membrane protein
VGLRSSLKKRPGWQRLVLLSLILVPCSAQVSVEAETSSANQNDGMALKIGMLQAIDMALETDVSLRQAKERLRQQRVDLAELKDPLSGSVNTSHNSTYSNSSDDLTNSESVNLRLQRYFGDAWVSASTNLSRSDGFEPYSTLVSMSFNQPLIPKRAGRGARVEDALLALEKSEEDYVRDRERFILEVVRQYYEMRKIEDLIEDNARATEEAKRQLKAVEIRYEAGVVAKIDVAKARIQLAESEQRELLARQGLDDARDSFALQLGLGLGTDYELTDDLVFKPEEINLEKAQELLLDEDQRLRDLQDELDRAHRDFKYAKRERLPDVNLTANYSASGRSDDFLSSLEVGSPNLTVSLKFDWRTDLFYDDVSESINREKIELAFREELFEIERDRILLDIRARLRGIRTRFLNLAQQELIFDEAQINLRLSQRSYEMQLGPLSDVIEAQQDMLEAKENLLDAQFSYFVDVLALKQDMGFDIEKLVRELFDYGNGEVPMEDSGE